jgi:hypothetical protein
MRVTAAGNVGIGTSSPAYKLDVNGSVSLGNEGTFYIRNSAGTAERFLTQSGSVWYVNPDQLYAMSIGGSNTTGVIAGGIAVAARSKFGATVGVGGTSPSSSGAGITFPASQSDSSDANTLDDYEEGTWTPVFTGVSGTNPTVTYTSQVGTYTKIGNRVIYEISVITSAATGGSGVLAISLPFATSGSSNNFHISLIGYGDLLSVVARTGYTDPGRSDMFFVAYDSTGGNLPVSALTNDGSGYLMMQGQYLIG